MSDPRSPRPDSAGATFTARANGSFDVAAAVRMLAAHTVPGVDRLDPDTATYERSLRVAGVDRRIRVRLTADGVAVDVDPDDDDHSAIAGIVRHWFDLDTDVTAVDRHLSSSAHLEEDVRRRPGVRITRYPDAFEAISTIILGQGVSLAASRTVMRRLVTAAGTTSPQPSLPTAADVVALPAGTLGPTLGIPARRAAALHTVAGLFADGYAPREDGLEPLGAIPGIGPWTLDSFALRAGIDGDAFPVGDAVLHRMLEEKNPRVLTEVAALWSPHRGYAAMRLWTWDATASTRPGTSTST